MRKGSLSLPPGAARGTRSRAPACGPWWPSPSLLQPDFDATTTVGWSTERATGATPPRASATATTAPAGSAQPTPVPGSVSSTPPSRSASPSAPAVLETRDRVASRRRQRRRHPHRGATHQRQLHCADGPSLAPPPSYARRGTRTTMPSSSSVCREECTPLSSPTASTRPAGSTVSVDRTFAAPTSIASKRASTLATLRLRWTRTTDETLLMPRDHPTGGRKLHRPPLALLPPCSSRRDTWAAVCAPSQPRPRRSERRCWQYGRP